MKTKFKFHVRVIENNSPFRPTVTRYDREIVTESDSHSALWECTKDIRRPAYPFGTFAAELVASIPQFE